MKYSVKVNYGSEFIFDNIEEAALFFDQGLSHAAEMYAYAKIEPVYPTADTAEEVEDD